MNHSGFEIYKEDMNHGYTMKFNNGWTISVRWGKVNYCNNQSNFGGKHDDITADFNESNTAEVAVFDPNDHMDALCDHDQVLPWQTPDDVAKIMVATMNRQPWERAKNPKGWEDYEDEESKTASIAHKASKGDELNMEED